MNSIACLLALCFAGACALPVETRAQPALPPGNRALDWAPLAGPLFGPDGPSPDDVFQGDLNDCALLARMSGLAAHHPERLRRSIEELPDGTFAVTLLIGPAKRAARIVVDREVPVRDGLPRFAATAPPEFVKSGLRQPARENTRPIWPAILEKALAIFHGGYASIDGDRFEQRGELDGSREFTVWLPASPPAAVEAALREALSKQFNVEMGNAEPKLAVAAGLKPAHAYAVLGLNESAGRSLLRLRDPTGAPPAGAMAGAGPQAGEVTLELTEALRSFRFMGISGPDLSRMASLAALPSRAKP